MKPNAHAPVYFCDRISAPFDLDLRGELGVKGIGLVSTCFLLDLPKDAAPVG